jgi:hypothetical protein
MMGFPFVSEVSVGSRPLLPKPHLAVGTGKGGRSGRTTSSPSTPFGPWGTGAAGASLKQISLELKHQLQRYSKEFPVFRRCKRHAVVRPLMGNSPTSSFSLACSETEWRVGYRNSLYGASVCQHLLVEANQVSFGRKYKIEIANNRLTVIFWIGRVACPVA